MGKKAKKTLNKEQIAEDWCFVCKDGGLLRICDYGECLKAYHPDCVGKKDSFLESATHWVCGSHICLDCKEKSKLSCYGCPKSVCKQCIDTSEFVQIRGGKGLCTHCLKIALLVEENKDVDSDDGEKVDFKDRDTYECLFKEYWAIINQKEGLTAEDLRSAKKRHSMGKNYISDADSEEFNTSEEEDVMNYNSDEERKSKRKKLTGKSSPGTKKLKKSSKKEFCGWGSKVLLEFLESIGENPSEKLSQHQVTTIINRYISRNKLFSSQKKKQVICDEQLKCLFGKNIVGKHKIFELLETHFAENLDSSSDEEDYAYNSEEMDGSTLVECKKQRKSNKIYLDKEDFKAPFDKNTLASLDAKNINLIYLKRSLVKTLLYQNESFESKVVGSFVRVKSDPNDIFQKNPYQLVQVTGIKKNSAGEIDNEFFLKVSSMPEEISISNLTDDDFSEEEFEDLRLRVEHGQLKKLTVYELEQKARLLHEDQTNHWIQRQLILLDRQIEKANEKGWRRELFDHSERKKLLSSQDEQSRLLKQFPEVIPVHEELDKNNACKEIQPKSPEVPDEIVKASGSRSAKPLPLLKECPKANPQVEEHSKDNEFEELSPISILAASSDLPFETLSEHNQLMETMNEKQDSSKLAAVETPDRPKLLMPAPKSEVIELSSDEEEEDNDKTETKKLDVPETSEWFCLGAKGETTGPHLVSFLKRWSGACSSALKLKVWRTDQRKEDAVLLGDVVKN